MDPLLFGLTEPHAANWASKAVPELSGEKLSFIAPLGDERMHITTSSNEDQIILEVLFAIDGMNRQRSSVRSAEIDLGSFSVYSTNIGISVQYKCTYPTAITVETGEFSVKVISNLGKKEGTGNLANGFQLNISSASEIRNRFLLGSIMEVKISWSADLLMDFTFTIDQCSISHGDVSIQLIKNGCFSKLLQTNALQIGQSHTKGFSYRSFKANDEDARTQVLTCVVSVCRDLCKVPRNTLDCPKDPFLQYRPT